MIKMMIDKAKTYKRAVARRYLPVSSEEIVSKVREADKYYLSTKFDGHLYILIYEDKKASLFNHFGTIHNDLPLKSPVGLKRSTTNKIAKLTANLYSVASNCINPLGANCSGSVYIKTFFHA